jgi:homocitrate synthase NifV
MLRIADTTLRDGEQAPGVVFSFEDKFDIALLLERLGVDELEIGTPAVSRRDRDDIVRLVAAGFDFDISCWCRAVPEDIDECINTGADIVNVSLPVSDILLEAMDKNRNWVRGLVEKLTEKEYFSAARISIGLQDASRADFDFLLEITRKIHGYGAFRVRFADTVGILNPMRTIKIIKRLKTESGIEMLEFHGHNDLGMAVGNSLAAVAAGADSISTTVNGLGERAGNCPTEELYFALKYSMGIDCGRDLSVVNTLCRRVAEASKRPIPPAKPLTGAMAYRHESGIHVDCLKKNINTYQLVRPEESGAGNIEFVIGKHSGRTAVRNFFADRNIILSEAEAAGLLELVKEHASMLGRGLDTRELIEIYRTMPPLTVGKNLKRGNET